jgi:hypothetical protein
MSRLQTLKQRAASRGVFIMRSFDNDKKWDVVDSCGPRGLQLTRRGAIQFAHGCARNPVHIRGYVTDVNGQWHRGICEKVAPKFSPSRPCKCSRLVVHSTPRK